MFALRSHFSTKNSFANWCDAWRKGEKEHKKTESERGSKKSSKNGMQILKTIA